MTFFLLKIIAMVTMVADHVSIAFADGNMVLRVIGRLAFAAYAFLMAEGFRHYRDDKKRMIFHFVRLTTLMVVSEFAFDYFSTGNWIDWSSQSAMPVFWLGFIGLWLTEKFREDEQMYVLVIYSVCAYITKVLATEYNFMGVLLIFAFYWIQEMFDKKDAPKSKRTLWIFIATFAFALLQLAFTVGFKTLFAEPAIIGRNAPLLAGTVAAGIIPALYNGEVGLKNRVLNEAYAWFYPIQFLLLALIANAA